MMPRVDKTMLLAVLAGAAIAAVSASCANSCSGHGTCGSHDRCTCYSMWEGTDCSLKSCPSGPSFASGGAEYEACSGRGVCDSSTGQCACSEGYTGYNCGRTACPNDCSGHGKCLSAGVDGGMTQQCVCDGFYTGADCSFRQCPRGDDPLTTEIECQGVASGTQAHEVQEITLTADKMLSGAMTLTYTDAYGQAWTTAPIDVGGDNTFDLRASGTGGCSLVYTSATLTPEKFRTSGAIHSTEIDFGATEFTVPSVAEAAMTASDCDTLTAAQMEALLEQNGAVKNVKVTKSEDVAAGSARFHVSIGDINFQNENDGMEIGTFSLAGRSSATDAFHPLGDRSQAIKDGLQGLPYGVIPSVTVSRVKVDGGSDFADSTVVFGNMVQQKYRVTFSDAANAGDQNMLQCNAEGCDADGCAPRYAGVTHKRYISTKYNSDPMDPNGGVTDFRTAIVATGQGTFWLRHHSLDVRTASYFTSGTYHLHWDLGNGKVSSASWDYNANEAAIQAALQTIEGWGGVSVSCYGTPGMAGRDYTKDYADGAAYFGQDCKVTYAKGFDDGGKLPTMTYTNIHQAMDTANDGSGALTHRYNFEDDSFECVNEICTIGGMTGTDFSVLSLFEPPTGQKTGTVTAFGTYAGSIGKADNWIGYVYIRHENSGGTFPLEGTYEIVRAGSSGVQTAATADLMIYAPGVPDTANFAAGFGGAANEAYLYKATPLMVMWPSFSNSIALHDTSFRMIYDSGSGDETSVVAEDQPQRFGAVIAANANDDTFFTGKNANIHYGPLGTRDSGDQSNYNMHANARCSDIQTLLAAHTGVGPYPSLRKSDYTSVDADATTSICDCKRTSMEVPPFEIEITITCPGWLGYLIQNDAVRGGADANGRETTMINTRAQLKFQIGTATRSVHHFWHHRRLSPERSLEQLVAVGDTVTITSSNSNTNKRFKVKSYAYDNMWGDGNKGSAIWTNKAGYLGGDHASGFLTGNSLSSAVDYVSYGDFVPFLKVDPAPADDYQVWEMYTEGTNGTHFTRTLEDISTSQAETATLKLYPVPLYEGVGSPATLAAAASNVNQAGDASALTGMFQVIYDGEESPVMPVTSSANQVMEFLAQMTSLPHVPTVVKSDGTTGTLGDTVEAVTSYADYVAWTFTFDPRVGDAKKLTFKYVDAVGDEQVSSNVYSPGSPARRLVNSVASMAHEITGTISTRYVNNKILMSYSSGSTFYDAIDADYDGASTAVDTVTIDDLVQDELAMDVVPGTTMLVKSAETFHVWFYEMLSEGSSAASATTIDLTAGCTGTANENQAIVVEYEGVVSNAIAICTAASTWQTQANVQDAIVAAHPTLKGISYNVLGAVITNAIAGVVDSTPAALAATFNGHFAWGADHVGAPSAVLSLTLPIGANGDSFKVHYQRPIAQASGISRFSAAANVNYNFRVFTHRERNNNGRTFTVTKAYENKISDLRSVSRIAAYTEDPGGGLLHTGLPANIECGATVDSNLNPGTYYGVKLLEGDTGNAGASTGTGRGAELMVVVDGAGDIAEAQVTAGGAKYIKAHTFYFADTRMHASMSLADDATACKFTMPDQVSVAARNTATKGFAVGLSTAATCMGLTAGSAQCGADGNAIGAGNARKHHHVPSQRTITAETAVDGDVTGVRYTVTCSAGNEVTAIQTTASGAAKPLMANTAALLIQNDGTSSVRMIGQIGESDGDTANAAEVAVSKDCVNDFYWQFGFYSTGTPRFSRDSMHNNQDMGLTPKNEQVTLYGMKTHLQYPFNKGTANMATDTFYGLARDTFTDLNSQQTQQVGYSILESATNTMPQATTSVVAGENGANAGFTQDATSAGMWDMVEHAEKGAYIGKGYDQLTVTPMPDPMSSKKVIITYTGPSAGCAVTEVDRGTHESAECSGRGNCDYTTGTCLCDAGYTLEACSEQTVLV